jgi:predicted membrane protein
MKNYNKNSGCSGKGTGLFFGLLVTLAGALLLAFNLGWIDPQFRKIVFSWQMILVFFALISLVKRQYVLMLFWAALGAFFLLPKIGTVCPEALPWIIEDFAKNYWPILLIFLGIFIVLGLFSGKGILLLAFGNSKKNTVFGHTESTEGTDGIYERNVVFGGAEDVFLEPVFRGGNISVVFGGVELDLRKTTILEGDTRLNIDVVFGGVELRVPDNWKLIKEIGATFGAVEESRKIWAADIDESRRLIITGNVVFGGCEIQ